MASSGSHAADWSSLPTDLLLLILQRLPIADYVRLGSVCASWNRTVSEKLCPPAPQLPWLMFLIKDDKGCGIVMFDIILNKKVCMIRPPEHKRFICSTPQGYLVFLDKTLEQLIVMNPLTGSHVPLPSFANFPDRDIEYVSSAALCKPHAAETVTAVAIVYSCGITKRRIAFAKVGDVEWTLLLPEYYDKYMGIIFHKELLYVVYDPDGKIVTWDLQEHQLGGRHMIMQPNEDNYYHYVNHDNLGLMVSPTSRGGDLIQVRIRFSEMCWEWVRVVFMLDTKVLRWCRFRHAGDYAVMLSSRSSMCISDHDFLEPESVPDHVTYRQRSWSDPCITQHIYNARGGRMHIPSTEVMDMPHWFAPSLSN